LIFKEIVDNFNHISRITYHISRITYHISHITYHVSHITYHVTCIALKRRFIYTLFRANLFLQYTRGFVQIEIQ